MTSRDHDSKFLKHNTLQLFLIPSKTILPLSFSRQQYFIFRFSDFKTLGRDITTLCHSNGLRAQRTTNSKQEKYISFFIKYERAFTDISNDGFHYIKMTLLLHS